MKINIGSILLGILMLGAYAGIAFTQAGTHDCVVHTNASSCIACSGCTIDQNGDSVCGTAEASITCPGNQQPDCKVSVGPGGTTYTADCENRKLVPIGGPGGIF